MVSAGDALLAPSITRRLIDRFARPAAPVASSPRVSSLTAREREVWTPLARGLSNTELADRLHVTEATVKTHVARLLAKLGVRDRVHAVVLAYELGVVRPGDR